MSVLTKTALVAIAILANVLLLGWRFWIAAPLPVLVEGPAPLLESQAELVLRWQRAGAVPLNAEAIAGYVGAIHWSNCLQAPPDAEPVPIELLPTSQRTDLELALAGLIDAYCRGTSDALVDYMAARGQELSEPMIVELKRILAQDAGISTEELAAMPNRDVVRQFAAQSGYAAHWTQLVADTGCGAVWRPAKGPSATVDEPLGVEATELFQNQTRFHHLFVHPRGGDNPAKAPQYKLFADARFVIRHDASMYHEPSPYFVRFGYDSQGERWQPVEMIHVPTASGTSPVLLF